MVQLGANANEAKVFKAHAAPQGLCEILIITIRVLANQQTDGDSPIQSIATGLHERSGKGIMDGLRSFIEIDTHSAVDDVNLHRGMKPFSVQKPNFSEGYPEAAIREGADDSTLRAEDVKTLNACINIDHNEENIWGPPLFGNSVGSAPHRPNLSLGQSTAVPRKSYQG